MWSYAFNSLDKCVLSVYVLRTISVTPPRRRHWTSSHNHFFLLLSLCSCHFYSFQNTQRLWWFCNTFYSYGNAAFWMDFLLFFSFRFCWWSDKYHQCQWFVSSSSPCLIWFYFFDSNQWLISSKARLLITFAIVLMLPRQERSLVQQRGEKQLFLEKWSKINYKGSAKKSNFDSNEMGDGRRAVYTGKFDFIFEEIQKEE